MESAQCVCLTSPCSCHHDQGRTATCPCPIPRCPITSLSVHEAWPLSQRQPHMHVQEGSSFFIHLNTRRENQTSQIVPLQQLFYSWLHLITPPPPINIETHIFITMNSYFCNKTETIKTIITALEIFLFQFGELAKKKFNFANPAQNVSKTAENLCRTLTCISL